MNVSAGRLSSVPSGRQSPKQASRQIVGLDALRFLASLLVVAFHLIFWNWTRAMNTAHQDHVPFRSLVPITWVGWIGVEIFFVLSGFVITYSAQEASARLFVQNRLARLFPAALVCATVTFAVVLLQPSHPALHPLSHWWLKSILFSPVGPYIDDSYWTLSIEVAFYFIVFLLLWLRRPRALTSTMAFIGGVSSIAWIADICFHRWLGSFGPVLDRQLSPEAWQSNFLLLRHGCYFTLGVFLWLYLSRSIRLRHCAVIALCLLGAILQIVARTRYIDTQSEQSHTAALPVAIWLLAVAIIVLSVRYNAWILHLVRRPGVAFLRRLGLITYPLYLIHQKVGVILLTHLRRGHTDAFALLFTLSSILLLAYVISRFAEPLLQLGLKRLFSLSPVRTRVPGQTR